MKKTLLMLGRTAAGRPGVLPERGSTVNKRLLVSLFLMSLIGSWLYLHRVPHPTDTLVWCQGSEIVEFRAGGALEYYSLPEAGPGDTVFAFWRDKLVFWAGQKQMLGVLSHNGAIRWLNMPGVVDRPFGIGANRDGILISLLGSSERKVVKVIHVALPSGAVTEIPDVVAFDCSERSDEVVVETQKGRLELRTPGGQRVLEQLPPKRQRPAFQSWRYDFQNGLLVTLGVKDVSLWKAREKVRTITTQWGPMEVLPQPEKRLLYVLSVDRMLHQDFDCYDYAGHLKAHATVMKGVFSPVWAPSARQLETLERLPVPDS